MCGLSGCKHFWKCQDSPFSGVSSRTKYCDGWSVTPTCWIRLESCRCCDPQGSEHTPCVVHLLLIAQKLGNFRSEVNLSPATGRQDSDPTIRKGLVYALQTAGIFPWSCSFYLQGLHGVLQASKDLVDHKVTVSPLGLWLFLKTTKPRTGNMLRKNGLRETSFHLCFGTSALVFAVYMSVPKWELASELLWKRLLLEECNPNSYLAIAARSWIGDGREGATDGRMGGINPQLERDGEKTSQGELFF